MTPACSTRRSPTCRLVSLNVPEASTATYASNPLPTAAMAGKAAHEPKTLPLDHAQSVRSDPHNRTILLVLSWQHSNFESRVPSRVDLSCSVRLDFVDNLREKPCASLGLVDPHLNEACCRNVTMPSADLVCPAQELY